MDNEEFVEFYAVDELEDSLENEIDDIEEEDNEDESYIKMDYSIETAEGRVEKVNEIISKTPPERLTPRYLEKLSDYIIMAMTAEEKKEKKYITENRAITLNKREVSFDGMVSHFETNENTGDVIYNLITNDKNIIFQPKICITEEDIEEVPGLKELREEIEKIEAQCKAARGKKAYSLKKTLIAMRKDQYVLKNAYKPISVNATNTIKSFKKLDLTEHIYIDAFGEVQSTGFINFFNPLHVSALLCNYEKLKNENETNFLADAKWMLMDFDNLIEETFKDYPLLQTVIHGKIYGYTNAEIQEILKEKHNTTYSAEYISYLWRNKIPEMIVEQATEDWLIWHYTFEEKGYWKKCNRCGEIKLGINKFFSKNSSSKDGLYSICKKCRNSKAKLKTK